MGPENIFVHFKHVCRFLFLQTWSSSHQMSAWKGYYRNPNSTNRYKLDRVAPVDNRPPNDKNGGPKQWCPIPVSPKHPLPGVMWSCYMTLPHGGESHGSGRLRFLYFKRSFVSVLHALLYLLKPPLLSDDHVDDPLWCTKEVSPEMKLK